MSEVKISSHFTAEDFEHIDALFLSVWLDTYPNVEVGITRDDVQVFLGSETDEMRARRKKVLSTFHPDKLFLKAMVDKKIVGVCTLIKREGYGQLQSIYILKEYQGQGIGTLFWKEAEKFFAEYSKIIVQVATYNTDAIAFYEKLGFKDTGKRFTEERHKMPLSGKYIPEMEMVLLR